MDRNQILNDPETAMRYALQGLQAQMWTAMPAIVQSVDLEAMTVDCTPAIKGVQTDDNQKQTFVTMPMLVDCPLVFPSGGGFLLTFPIQEGDEVLIVIASRCIDAWWQSGSIQNPIELRMHDLSDGFAIPGPRSQPKVASGISASAAQLRSDDGTIVFGPDGMTGLFKFENATASLNGILSDMNNALITFATGLNPGTLAGKAAALVTALTLVTAEIAELLE